MVLRDLLQKGVVRPQRLRQRRVEEAILEDRMPLLGRGDRLERGAEGFRAALPASPCPPATAAWSRNTPCSTLSLSVSFMDVRLPSTLKDTCTTPPALELAHGSPLR